MLSNPNPPLFDVTAGAHHLAKDSVETMSLRMPFEDYASQDDFARLHPLKDYSPFKDDHDGKKFLFFSGVCQVCLSEFGGPSLTGPLRPYCTFLHFQSCY